jgi:hypothetical protein
MRVGQNDRPHRPLADGIEGFSVCRPRSWTGGINDDAPVAGGHDERVALWHSNLGAQRHGATCLIDAVSEIDNARLRAGGGDRDQEQTHGDKDGHRTLPFGSRLRGAIATDGVRDYNAPPKIPYDTHDRKPRGAT